MYETSDLTLHRAWRFSRYDPGESHLFFVDTRGGDLVGVENQVFNEAPLPECKTWGMYGWVDGWATPDVAADSDANPQQLTELPGALVTVIEDIDPNGTAVANLLCVNHLRSSDGLTQHIPRPVHEWIVLSASF